MPFCGSVAGSHLSAVTVAVGVLPLAIPLAPLTWFRFTPGTGEARSVRGLGVSMLWAILTMPLAIALGLYLTRLVGGE